MDEKILGRKNPNEPGGIYPAEKDWGEKIITRTLRFLIRTVRNRGKEENAPTIKEDLDTITHNTQ